MNKIKSKIVLGNTVNGYKIRDAARRKRNYVIKNIVTVIEDRLFSFSCTTELSVEQLEANIKKWLTYGLDNPCEIISITSEIEETKTIYWWMNKLEEPYRSAFLAERDRFAITNNWYSEEVSSLSVAINSSFTWVRTIGGQSFWEKIYSKANHGKFKEIDGVFVFDVDNPIVKIEVENVKIEVENIVITEPGQEASFEDWFQLLPESCREEALSQPRTTYPTYTAMSLSKALYKGFIWDNSPSGDSFWRNIADSEASEIENKYFENIKKLQDATTMD